MLTEKDYCDYDTCVALKELGFNQYNSIRYYAGVGGVKLWDFDGEPNYKEGELIALSDLYGIPRDGNEVAAPSLYEAQKWLREEKGIFVHISHPLRVENDVFWSYEVLDEAWDDVKQKTCICASGGLFDSYEEALLRGVRQAVNLLKENK